MIKLFQKEETREKKIIKLQRDEEKKFKIKL